MRVQNSRIIYTLSNRKKIMRDHQRVFINVTFDSIQQANLFSSQLNFILTQFNKP